MSLRKQAISGMFWTFSQQFGTKLISFIVGVILARVLLPSDFGTIAMFGVVIAVATTLIDGGLTSSLIRTKKIDEKDLSTVFWFNLVIATLLYGIIFFTAPLVSLFYEVEILTPIIRIYSLIIIINAFATVQQTTFTREMDFKTTFKIQLPSLIIGGASGVLMALSGMGIWSLVFYPLIQSIVSTIQFWFYSKWKPALVFDKNRFRFHFNYGYKLTLAGLLNTVFQNVYTVIIGKMFSTAQLGFYNRADTLKQLPVANLSMALNKVTFPLFAKISHDDIKLKEVYKKMMKVVVFVVAPTLSIMIVSAEPLIRFLMTEKWLPAVPYFQVLALAGILFPVHVYNLNVLNVKGRTDLFLKLEILKKILIVLVLILSVRYGIMGIVWGQVFVSVIAFFINSHYTGKLLNYGALQQLTDIMPSLILSGLIAYLFYWLDLNFFEKSEDIIRLLLISIGFTVVYLGMVLLLRFRELDYIKQIIKK